MARCYIMLFQHGSNMDPDRLNAAERLDGAAEVVGKTRLQGWGVRFDLYSEKTNRCGVTDIVPSTPEHVEDVLYRVAYRLVVAPRGQRSQMDKIEGAGLGEESNYKRLKVWVLRNGKEVEARTYVGTALGRERFLRRPNHDRRVSQAYFSHLLAGARQFNFSERYISYLRRHARIATYKANSSCLTHSYLFYLLEVGF